MNNKGTFINKVTLWKGNKILKEFYGCKDIEKEVEIEYEIIDGQKICKAPDLFSEKGPEIWAPFPPPYEDFDKYMISNYGRVKSLYFGKEKILALKLDNKGYYRISIRNPKTKKDKTFLIQRLVALTFVPNLYPDECHIVDHKDGNPKNNYYRNLQWCNQYFNCIRKYTTNTIILGEDSKISKLTNQEVLEIYDLANKSPLTNAEIANEYGLSSRYISDIKNGIYWTHIINHNLETCIIFANGKPKKRHKHTPKNNIEKRIMHPHTNLSITDVKEIFYLIWKSPYDYKEIMELYNLPSHKQVFKIKNAQMFIEITKPLYNEFRDFIEEQKDKELNRALEIYVRLWLNNLTYREAQDIYDISKPSAYRIKKGRQLYEYTEHDKSFNRNIDGSYYYSPCFIQTDNSEEHRLQYFENFARQVYKFQPVLDKFTNIPKDYQPCLIPAIKFVNK